MARIPLTDTTPLPAVIGGGSLPTGRTCRRAEKARALRLDERALTALERGGLIAKRFSAPSVAEGAEAVQAPRSEDEIERYLQAQQLMSDAINQHLGFRGYGLMMRLQKTANVRDLHDMLPDFAKALVKRIGMAPATPIVGLIERLITRQ